MNDHIIKPIAKIYNSFDSKFAIPRQSGILNKMKSEIIFEKEFCVEEAFRGIDGFSHLWLIWRFSDNPQGKWSPTVRPPKLGGNKRMGVFATRSPFRPNSLGLSSVKLAEVKKTKEKGIYLVVYGADLLNGTPIYDVKPYLPFSDIHPDATSGFTDNIESRELSVVVPPGLQNITDKETLDTIIAILKQDPRPGFHEDSQRIYGFSFEKMEIKFKVDDKTLYVTDIIKGDNKNE